MSDLDELAKAVRSQSTVHYARPVVVQEVRGNSLFYYLMGLCLCTWTLLCVLAAGFVIYSAVTDDSDPTLAEVGGGYGLLSDTRITGMSRAVKDYVHGQRLGGAAILVGGAGVGWAVLATPMALTMIALKR